jgi:hypothetical protein
VDIRCAPIKGSSITGVFKKRNFLFSLKMDIVTTFEMVVIGCITKINKPCFWEKIIFWKETSA